MALDAVNQINRLLEPYQMRITDIRQGQHLLSNPNLGSEVKDRIAAIVTPILFQKQINDHIEIQGLRDRLIASEIERYRNIYSASRDYYLKEKAELISARIKAVITILGLFVVPDLNRFIAQQDRALQALDSALKHFNSKLSSSLPQQAYESANKRFDLEYYDGTLLFEHLKPLRS